MLPYWSDIKRKPFAKPGLMASLARAMLSFGPEFPRI
jgi:hypothetical protein